MNKTDISAEMVMSNCCVLLIYRRKASSSRMWHCRGDPFLNLCLPRDISSQSAPYTFVWIMYRLKK